VSRSKKETKPAKSGANPMPTNLDQLIKEIEDEGPDEERRFLIGC
jgi:hypothetical protein